MKLSTNHITVLDLDTPGKDLLVWLVTPPKYGHIENAKKGEAWLGERYRHTHPENTPPAHVNWRCGCVSARVQDCLVPPPLPRVQSGLRVN